MAGTDLKGAAALARAAALAAVALFALWAIGPAQADAARCGGRKATMVGGEGDNVLKAPKKGPQVIVGGSGDDLIIARRNKDFVCGGAGADRIYAGTGRDRTFGGSGDDFIDEGPGSGKVVAGAGADRVVGGGGGDRIRGGPGDDRLFGEIQDDKVFGEAGNDLLVGGQGTDNLRGAAGDDWARGDTNQDKYFGDAGTDTVSYATATPPGPHPTRDGVDVDLRAGVAYGDDSREGAVQGFENVIGSAFEDRLVGAGGGFVRGNGGGDTCTGFASSACGEPPGAPVALIADGGGPDPGVMVIGGPGAESLTISESAGAVRISGSAIAAGPGCSGGGGEVVCARPGVEFGYILLWGAGGSDSLSVGGGLAVTTGVKGDGGPGDDSLAGGPAADVLFPGESGSDRLFGGAGDDALAGRPGGGDLLVGGPGNDNLATDDACAGHVYDGGGGGADVAGFAQAGEGAGVTARLGGTAVRRGAGGCAPTRIQNDLEVLEGTRNPDRLFGNGGSDLVIGREGNDYLQGRAGRDELRGGSGNDRCPDRSAIKFSC
ncbi:MAG: calcium-binding protein [Solirubrobacterales bacterium]